MWKELYNLLAIYWVDESYQEDENLKSRIEEIINTRQELIALFSQNLEEKKIETIKKTYQEIKTEVTTCLEYLTEKKWYKVDEKILLHEKWFSNRSEFVKYLNDEINLHMWFMADILKWVETDQYRYWVMRYIINSKEPKVWIMIKKRRKLLSLYEENSWWVVVEGKPWWAMANVYAHTGMNIRQMLKISEAEVALWQSKKNSK